MRALAALSIALALAALGGSAAGSSRTAAAPPAQTLRTAAPASLLAADGPLAAAVVPGDGKGRCTEIVLWRPGTAAPTLVKTQVGCGGGAPLEGVTELALGGKRVIWQETNGGNNLELIVQTATTARPAPAEVSYVENGNGAAGDPGGEYTGHLLADGQLLVFTSWTHCDPYADQGAGYAEKCAAGGPELSQGALHRVVAGKAAVLRRGDDVLAPLWVDGGRILVHSSDSTLTLLRTSGAPLRTFDVGPGHGEAAFQGTRLAVLRPTSLDVYDTASGERVHSFLLARKTRHLADLQSGIAVLVSGGAVHLLRLDTGKGTTVVPRGGGTIHAQLEASGLFTSSSTGLSFLPLATLLARLGSG
jgi:hypothetical protein